MISLPHGEAFGRCRSRVRAAPVTQDPVKAIAYSLHDSLMVLAPKGWSNLELEMVQSQRGLRLASMSIRGEGRATAPRMPALGIDKEHEALRVGEAVEELALHLSHEGKSWSGGTMRVNRGPTHTDFSLLHEGRPAFMTRLLESETNQLIITDPLLDALLGTEAAFHDVQKSVSPEMPGPRLELGLYDRQSFIFHWNHPNPTVGKATQATVRPPGLSAFWRTQLACDEGFAWALCGHIAMVCNARGLLRDETSGVRFFAILRP